MPDNLLVTGRPGSGKTSVILKAAEILKGKGLKAGGIYCPEVREGGARMGFNIVDLVSGEERVLAKVGLKGPKVGKYGVDVAAVDEISGRAIDGALREADFVVVDEIAPMELHSQGFGRAVLAALDSRKPLLAAIHQRAAGFAADVKSRRDVELFEVTAENREKMPSVLAARVEVAIRKISP